MTSFLVYLFLLFIYLTALDLSCSMLNLHCCVGALQLLSAGSVVVSLGLQSSGTQKLPCTTYGLSCCPTYGILFSQPATTTASPTLQGGFLTTGLPGRSHNGLISVPLSFFFRKTGMIILSHWHMMFSGALLNCPIPFPLLSPARFLRSSRKMPPGW